MIKLNLQNSSAPNTGCGLKSLQANRIRSANPVNFAAAANTTDRYIDKFLKSKGGLKILQLADINPTLFSLGIATAVSTTLRPATLMVVPGAKKEDKKYASVKSIISAIITLATQGLVFYPLGVAMKKLGEKADTAPKLTKFPYKIKTLKFEACNYFLNNSLGFFVTIATTLIMVKVVGAIMNKIMPPKNDVTLKEAKKGGKQV